MKSFLKIIIFIIGTTLTDCKNTAPCDQLDSSCNLISSLILERQIRESRNVLVFSPPGGTYKFDQFVTITSGPASSVIRYTTDGSEPTCSTGNIYTSPVPMKGILTQAPLRAIACNETIMASSRRDNYTITVSPFRTDSNLRFWYTADSMGLENGSEVKIWNDLSGNGNHLYPSSVSLTNPTFITNALNGKPAVRLNSQQRHFMNTKGMSGYTATKEGTGVMVLRKYANQPEDVYFSIGVLGSIVNSRNWRGNPTNPSLCSSLAPNPSNCAGFAATQVALSGYHVIIFSIDTSGAVTYYYDGVSQGAAVIPPTAFTFAPANSMNLGTGMNVTNFLDAEILEILFFEKSFDSNGIPTINCLMQNKYGLAIGGTSCL